MFGVLQACLLIAVAQTPSGDAFSSVPQAKRSRLAERLKSFIEYQQTQQWSKQYDLLSALVTRAMSRSDYVVITRNAYIKWGRAPLLQFVPIKVVFLEVDPSRKTWFVLGCSEVLEKQKKVNRASQIEAYWEKNDWFFSEIHDLIIPDNENPCLQKLNRAVNFHIQ